jgi:putative transposase
MESKLPNRSWPSHPPPVEKHNRPTIVFVTFNTKDRHPILCTEQIHDSFRKVWKEATHWVVGYYLIMPDHVHLFCSPGVSHPCSIRNWTRYCKRQVVKLCPELRGQWQNDCWDTQIRDGAHYQRKLDYVACNPVRRGLIREDERWPFQGVMNELHWLSD